MGLHIGKYAFNSEKQAKSKIKALGTQTTDEGVEYPTHPHIVTELGIERLSEDIYNERMGTSTGSYLRHRLFGRCLCG